MLAGSTASQKVRARGNETQTSQQAVEKLC